MIFIWHFIDYWIVNSFATNKKISLFLSADSSTADKKRIVIGYHKKVAVFFAGSACKKKFATFLWYPIFIFLVWWHFVIAKNDAKQLLLNKFFDIFNIGGATLLFKVADKVSKK